MNIPAQETPNTTYGIQWHDDHIKKLNQEVSGLHSTLCADLIQGVTSEDLIIGGWAVHDALHPNSGADTDYSSEATFTVERWAVDDNSGLIVRIARGRQETVNTALAHLLARHVRGAWRWVPGIEDRRTRKIAQLASADSILKVDILEGCTNIDDEILRETFASAESPPLSLRVDSTRLEPLDRTQVLAAAASAHLRGTGNRTLAEPNSQQSAQSNRGESILHRAQHMIDARVQELAGTAAALSKAATAIRTGRRVRPSQTQQID